MKPANEELLNCVKDLTKEVYAARRWDEYTNRTPEQLARDGVLSKYIVWTTDFHPRKCYQELEKLGRRKRLAKHSVSGGYCAYWPVNEDGTPWNPKL